MVTKDSRVPPQRIKPIRRSENVVVPEQPGPGAYKNPMKPPPTDHSVRIETGGPGGVGNRISVNGDSVVE